MNRPMRACRPDRGFTLVELMVTLVIIGILAALTAPRFTRDRQAREGREFANDLARDLQKSRQEAVSTRLPIRAFIYSDRVDLRAYKAGATLMSPPVAPTVADPLLRTIQARAGVSIWDATPAAAVPGGQALNTSSTYRQVDFTTLGGSVYIPAQPIPQGAFIYIDNGNAPANHPERRFRIDVAALTGFVQLRTSW